GASAAGLIAGVGTLTYNELANATSASLRTDANITSAGSVLVQASDSTPLTADAAGLAVSLGAGVRGSFAINTLNNSVSAYSDGADATLDSGQFELTATSSNDLDAFGLAFGAGGIIGGFATFTSNTVNTTTDASVRRAGTIVAPSVLIHAS